MSYTPDPKYGKMPPKVVDEARFFAMLEVLPPGRWYRGGHMEWFHVIERLSGNIVSWFARVGTVYLEFQDEADLPKEDIRAIVLMGLDDARKRGDIPA